MIDRGEDFLALGYEMTNAKLGARFVKYSDKVSSLGDLKVKYLGEWSVDTKLPHGKGIQVRQDGSIRLANYINGEMAEGRFVTIYKSGWISVGETVKD